MTLAQLLVVQSHDTAITQLEHRRSTLPELDALAMLDDEQQHVEAQKSASDGERAEISRVQKRLDDDISLLSERIDRENERLYSGSVTAHKDLQALQDELRTLTARRERLEDDLLEQMELAEPIDAAIDGFDTQLAGIAGRREEVQASLAASNTEIDALLAVEQKQRMAEAVDIEADLLAEYERAREECGGVGVARLANKTCEGCRLQQPAVALDRMSKAPPDALLHCECGRILVRT